MTSLSYGSADWFSHVSVANELIAQYSNTWLPFAVAVRQRTSETLHLPQLHLIRSATRYAILGYSYVLFVQLHYFLSSQQHVVDVLVVALYLLCSIADQLIRF